MDSEEVRPWPVLPKECLENIACHGGPQAAALLSSTCKSWRNDLSDETIWRRWHALPLLRYHTYQSSYSTYAQSIRNWLAGREMATALVPAAHERWLTSLDLSASHVLSGSLDANVKYWDRGRTGTWLHYLRGHTGPVSSVRLAYDNFGSCTAGSSRAYSGSRDGTLRCWDLTTGACVRAFTLEGGRQWVNTVAVWRPHTPQPKPPASLAAAAAWEQNSPDAAAAAAAGAHHNTISRFGTMGGSSHGAIGTASPAAAAATAASPMTVVCGTSIGQLCLYDVRQPGPAQRMLMLQHEPAPGSVYGVAVYGDALAAACASGCIYVWDLRAGSVRYKLDEHGSACTCVAMYGHTLVAGDLEGSVYLWSTDEARMRFRGAMSTAGRMSQISLSKPTATTAGSIDTATATAATATAVATRDCGAAALAGCATASFSGSIRTPPGPRWPYWRPHRRRLRLKIGPSGSSSNSSSSSDAEDGPRRSPRTGVDGAVATTVLQALAEGRLLMSPNRNSQLLGSPWLRSGSTRCAPLVVADGCNRTTIRADNPDHDDPSTAAGAVTAGGAAVAAADGKPAAPLPSASPQPGLRAVMRHNEWVRDVALVGHTLVLSSSKDGLVCLSRTDTMQVVAVWDVAAPGAIAIATSAEKGPSCVRNTSHSLVSETASHVAGCPATTASGHVVNQVHALAADEWGFVAGCQDASMRVWSFLPGGVLPELSTQLCGDKRGDGWMTFRRSSDLWALSC
ncbi:hypothetical protein Vretimale_9161 [Volvox reticuliferus]|uniref:F-box domain-containing protein n=1 Tax=Volvox reticuliferus TaxID=1737510 RepID=A0A8J4LQ25_9CHLO|nr:hypothetical protein Vretimale_9161 [Volvox reticuliferus]